MLVCFSLLECSQWGTTGLPLRAPTLHQRLPESVITKSNGYSDEFKIGTSPVTVVTDIRRIW